MSGWNDAATPVYYEAFCRRHPRYGRANNALISHARITGASRVLDLAAGTGRTTEAALEALDPDGRIICVEKSAAMRAAGMKRIADARVSWRSTLPRAAESFDRILCGAAIWQFDPLAEVFQTLSGMLRRGGALCFNVPALYLLEADEPGGGSDPLLLSLPARLSTCSGAVSIYPKASFRRHHRTPEPLRSDAISTWLQAAGLRPQAWTFRVRVTQEAYAAWLKIPVLTDRMLGGLTADERARRIDAALASMDRSSWKWERWRGWTAWKPPAVARPRV